MPGTFFECCLIFKKISGIIMLIISVGHERMRKGIISSTKDDALAKNPWIGEHMNILLIDWNCSAIEGHTIFSVNPDKYFVNIRDLLSIKGEHNRTFIPDIIFQRERLGPRVFISGLEDIDCPKIFWSVDTHLNMFWHRYYARLFDVIVTPHVSIYNSLPVDWHFPDVRSFIQPGIMRKWIQHKARSHDIAFVGIFDENRPIRKYMANYLTSNYNAVVSSMPFLQMIELYDNTRIIPNESIYNEMNFRIMEGASCGCCVLTQDIGEDLYINFDQGKEVITYRHVQELDDLLRFFTKRPDASGKIGCAAQQRIHAQHLPKHRTTTLLDIARTCSFHACKGEEARRVLIFARIHWARSRPENYFLLPFLSDSLNTLEPHPEVTAMRLRLFIEAKQMNEAKQLLNDILYYNSNISTTHSKHSLDYHWLYSAASLHLQDWHLFRLFWVRYQESLQKPQRAMPKSMFHGCLLWADILERSGRICMPGFFFDAQRHCPETAFEVLLMARYMLQEEIDVQQWTQRIAALSKKTSLLHYQLECTARLSLNEPENWRARLDYAHSCLRTYRIDEGLAEVVLAREHALQAGQEVHCQRLLKGLGIRF